MFLSFMARGLSQDTTRHLSAIPVFAKGDTIATWIQIRSSVPHFEINQKQVDEWGAVDVGELVKILPGVQIRDYGGIGGVKTIAFRSLSAAHTSVVTDGFAMSAVRTGAVNLSDFELFGLHKVALSTGTVIDDLAPAASFAQANTISLQSTLLRSPDKMRVGMYTNLTSINAYEHGAYYQKSIGKGFFAGGQGMLRHGNGRYRFQHPDLNDGPELWRENTEMLSYRCRFAGGYSDKQTKWNISANYSNNQQELPGAAVLYNSSNDQTLETETLRIQSLYTRSFKQWKATIHGGYQTNYMRYFDPQYQNLLGYIDIDFNQASATGGFMMARSFRFPEEKVYFGSDIIYGSLDGSTQLIRPERMTNISVLGAKTVLGRFRLEGNLTAQLIKDQSILNTVQSGRKFQRLSPFLAIAYLPFKEKALRIRSFYKHSFRMPSFNDLYYNFIGNTNLEPEDAHMVNLGITYGYQFKNASIELTADGYYNHVSNKIIAIPTKDLFNWSMQNIGETSIQGFDMGGLFTHQLKKCRLDVNTSHSFNQSVDITDRNSLTYGHQIPYTPFYNGQAGIHLTRKGYQIGATALVSGFRYTLNENIYANYLPGFVDLNIGLSKTIRWKASNLLIDLKVMNLLANNYQVIRSFPMPGRHLQLRIKYRLEK